MASLLSLWWYFREIRKKGKTVILQARWLPLQPSVEYHQCSQEIKAGCRRSLKRETWRRLKKKPFIPGGLEEVTDSRIEEVFNTSLCHKCLFCAICSALMRFDSDCVWSFGGTLGQFSIRVSSQTVRLHTQQTSCDMHRHVNGDWVSMKPSGVIVVSPSMMHNSSESSEHVGTIWWGSSQNLWNRSG